MLRYLTGIAFMFMLFFTAMAVNSGSTEASVPGNIVNPKQVYTYEVLQNDLRKLEEAYPELIEVKVIGETAYGRNIYAVSLGKGLSTSYINGSNHAREWISTNLTMHMIDQYAQAHAAGRSIGSYNPRSILNHHKMWFVPMMNPDGVTLQQRGLSAFPSSVHSSLINMNAGSRDFTRWKANARGVDLNRQFDANWANLRNNPGRPYYERYKGSAPHTESEVRAVINLTNNVKPEMAVSYHSSGEVLYWNYNQSGYQLSRDRAHASRISRMTGYTLMGNHSAYSGGGYTDWFIDTFEKPAFTPELSPFVGPRHVPLSNYDRIWNQNREVGLYVAQQSHNMYTNRIRNTLIDANLIINGTRYTSSPGAVITQGRTLVPVRGVLENLGATVQWDGATQKVTVTRGSDRVELTVYSDTAYVNGQPVKLDVPAQLLNSRTMVPVRFISEALGARVQWDQQSRTVTVTQ